MCRIFDISLSLISTTLTNYTLNAKRLFLTCATNPRLAPIGPTKLKLMGLADHMAKRKLAISIIIIIKHKKKVRRKNT